MRRQTVKFLLAGLLAICSGAVAQETEPNAPARITDKLRADAEKLQPLVTSGLAKDFLAATAQLAEPTSRRVYRRKDKTDVVTEQAYQSLSPDQQAEFAVRDCPPEFYYETAYGSPLVYSRVLDLASPHFEPQPGMRILDFGFGTIGQLHLLATCGFDAHGVDIEPILEALYSEPQDTGTFGNGRVAIHLGQWPASAELRKAVGTGYHLITSKNTLKSGYLHPNPPPGQTVDPKRLVHLGVSDDEFLEQVAGALAPGGVFLTYNICPPQNPPDQPYIPWADGKSPFSREAFERAGFEILAFDQEDQPWVLDCFERLGYGEGKPPEQFAKEFFCWYTIVRKRK